MTFKKQVCSPELSERLCDLGVKQNSLYDWMKGDGEMGADFAWHLIKHDGAKHTFDKQFSAFTVAELGEMLPELTHTVKERLSDRSFRWHCYIAGRLGKDTQEGWSEADARAKMLIYLLENKLVTL